MYAVSTPSHRKPPHLRRGLVHQVPHARAKPAHPAARRLNVLQQRAERRKLRVAPAPRRRAAVDPVCVRRAAQVLVQARERAVLAVAEDALVRAAIPRALRRPVLRLGAREVGAVGVLDEPAGVGDDVVAVSFGGVFVDEMARRARGAGSGLQVKEQMRAFDKGFGAAAPWALDAPGSVDGGLQVHAKAVLVHERTATWFAEPVPGVHVLVLFLLVAKELRK